MAFPAPSTPRTRKISKHHKYYDTSLTFPRRSDFFNKGVGETPIKKEIGERDEEKTIKM